VDDAHPEIHTETIDVREV